MIVKQMLDSFILPNVSQWDNYEWLHFMHDGATPHFAPPVQVWLDNHFSGWRPGYLRTNKMACGKSWSYCTWFVFVELGPKRKSTSHNWENKMNWNNICEILCHCSLLTAKHKELLRLCLTGYRNECKIMGPTTKSLEVCKEMAQIKLEQCD